MDAHRKLIAGLDRLDVLSVKLTRVIRNDYTIQYFGRWIQIGRNSGVRPKAEVTIETRLDGAVKLRYKGLSLNYKILPHRPSKNAYAIPKSVRMDQDDDIGVALERFGIAGLLVAAVALIALVDDRGQAQLSRERRRAVLGTKVGVLALVGH